MLSEPRAPINDMSLPKDRRKILRSASDGCHSKSFSVLVVGVIKVVLTFSEVYKFKLVIGEQKYISGFDIAVTDALGLQKGASCNHTAVHGD